MKSKESFPIILLGIIVFLLIGTIIYLYTIIQTDRINNGEENIISSTDYSSKLDIDRTYYYENIEYDESGYKVVEIRYIVRLLDATTAEIEYIHIPSGGLPPKLTGTYAVSDNILTIYTSYEDYYGSESPSDENYPKIVEQEDSFTILENGYLQDTDNEDIVLK